MYSIKRTDEEISNQMNDGVAWEEAGGSAVRGMSYEQGVLAGLRWVTGLSDEMPIEELPPE